MLLHMLLKTVTTIVNTELI